MAFISDTAQLNSPHAWTFAGLAVDEAGACYAAERKGLREIKPKGLLVRYPNPFVNGGALPEVLYESPDPFQGLARAVSGAVHIYGAKHHYSRGDKFKTKPVARAQRIARIIAAGDRVIVALESPDAYVELVGDEYRPIDPGLAARCESAAGTAADDIWLSSSEGITHFDGQTWKRVKYPHANAHLASPTRDEVYALNGESEGHLVYRGSVRGGFVGLVPTVPDAYRFGRIIHAVGTLFVIATHGEERGLYRVAGAKLEQVVIATAHTGRVAGNAKVLWLENGIELLCFDGKIWKQVRRIHDGAPPSEKRKR